MQRKVVKFEIQDLLPIGLTLVVAGIGITYGMNVVGDVKSDLCIGTREHMSQGTCFVCPNSSHDAFITGQTAGVICSNVTAQTVEQFGNSSNVSAAIGGDFAVNASTNAMKGIAKIPEKMPLIATVIIAAVIIGILVRYLMVRFA